MYLSAFFATLPLLFVCLLFVFRLFIVVAAVCVRMCVCAVIYFEFVCFILLI